LSSSRDRRVAVRYREAASVSIVRIGLGETKGFGDGYEAIFGKKKSAGARKPTKAGGKAAAGKVKKKKK
jgi:hypothetical protein